MRILVFNRSRLEYPSAQAINVVQTCAALAREGASVVLHADMGRAVPESIFKVYGTAPTPNLTFRDMGWRWHAMALRLVASGLLRGRRGEKTVVLLREVRPYVPTLIEAAKRRGHLIAFEAHKAAGKMALEAATRATNSVGPPGGGSAPLAEGSEAPAGNGDVALHPESEAAAREHAALERAILDAVDILVAPQRLTLEAVRGLVRKGVPTQVVPNGTPPAPSMNSTSKDIDILYLGSLSAWKGVETLVAAMPRLYPYKLTIVGGRLDKDRRILQHKALQLGCAERIAFIPPVAPSEVWRLYARAKVGVVPLSAAYLEAREYTCPLKLLEMMAAGLPIVTSRLPSVQEYVREEEDVLMARSDDPDDFALTIRRLLEDPSLASRLTASSREKAGSMTYENRARQLLATFTEAAR